MQPQERHGERGSGLMLAILVVATMFTLIATSFIFLQQAKFSINRQLAYDGQAMNAAQAGLVDGLSWFRRQQTQPVGDFQPQRDLSASPPVNETDDPSLGLVREYEISDLGNVVGRYEMRLAEVDDVSEERGKDGGGAVWQLVSNGIVYVQKDKSKAYNEHPNQVITSAVARSEIQRLTLVPPANAAVNVGSGSFSTQANVRIFGNDDIAVAYPDTEAMPATGSADLDGNPTTSSVANYNDSVSAVFGVTQQELLGMADIRAASVAELPPNLPAMSLVVITGDADFTSARPLRGVGVLIVFGDLTLGAASNSSFNGLIYVDGDYEQHAPSSISGSVIVTGGVDLRGTSDFSELNYDDAIIGQIQRSLGQYRFIRNQVFGRS